jgi:hypothetical protein
MTTRKTTSTSKRTAKKPNKAARAKRSARPRKSSGLKVRMYRVGFGDFFLVTVPTSTGDKFILIDCGVFKGTSGTGDIGSIVEAVKDLRRTTDGKLALVIMTHRHADHIAGFAKAKHIFQEFEPTMVWMPYWEKFNDKAKARKKAAAEKLSLDGGTDEDENEAHLLMLNIEELATNLALQFRGREDEEAKEALAQLGNATGIEDFNAVAKGRKAGSNAVALDVLKNHLGKRGKNVRYYAAGDKPKLPAELEGLKATILGPPPKKARAFLSLMDLKKGVGQYLDTMTNTRRGPKAIEPFPKEWKATKRDYHERDLRDELLNYKQFASDVDNAQPDMLAAAASKIENFLNNQSLVVLFEFDGKKLLFAGDAQGGNWEYWLFKSDTPVKDPTKAGDLVEKSKELLQTIDFYKVGHHGSTNATPIQAVEAAIARPKSGKGFVSMCSTEDKVYGNRLKDTEVPRIPLMKVLRDGSCLLRSDAIKIEFTDAVTNKPKTVKARSGVKLPKPKTGTVRKAKLYLEYSF